MIITLWLTTIDGAAVGGWMGAYKDLWTKELDTGAVPLLDGHDQIVLWPTDEEGPQGGPMWDLKRRYVDASGHWHLELTAMVLNPTDEVRDAIVRMVARGGPPWHYRSWDVGQDGDPDERLRAGGWRKYGEDA